MAAALWVIGPGDLRRFYRYHRVFEEITPYDEATPAFMTFSVSLAFFFVFYGETVPQRRLSDTIADLILDGARGAGDPLARGLTHVAR